MKKGTPQKAAPAGKFTQSAPQVSAEDQIFTIRELSDHLRVHPTTIYRLLRQGRLPGFRVGSNWRFSREAISIGSASRQAAERPQLRPGADARAAVAKSAVFSYLPFVRFTHIAIANSSAMTRVRGAACLTSALRCE